MDNKIIQMPTRAEPLRKIRQKVFSRMQNAKIDTQDEEMAYLLGIVDTFMNYYE
ncbi:MAG: hypothetical protein IJ576_08720 [Synergistaceae bacterium]|nr:hypothetical protein [Synergistaceae bacterium]MBR1602011.1 hypothetical protein [Synergistaceae bacterium]